MTPRWLSTQVSKGSGEKSEDFSRISCWDFRMAPTQQIRYRNRMNISALRFRGFRIYLGGNIFALNALWMQRVTIGWIAWSLTSSASFVGFVAFINFAPTMIAGPLFGVLIDRVRVKQAAKATQTMMFIVALAFYFSFKTQIVWAFANYRFNSRARL